MIERTIVTPHGVKITAYAINPREMSELIKNIKIKSKEHGEFFDDHVVMPEGYCLGALNGNYFIRKILPQDKIDTNILIDLRNENV